MKDKHVYRPIPGFKDYYACNKGHVYSKKTGNLVRNILNKRKDGYLFINVIPTGGKKGKACSVHRLIAATWLSNPEKLPVVNHKDGNKLNNDVTNLEYISHQGNIKHAYDNKLIKPNRKPVCKLDENGKILEEYESVTQASKIAGLCMARIKELCTNDSNQKGKGYYFRFKADVANFVIIPKEKYKKVTQCKEDGTELKTFASSTEAAEKLGCNNRSIEKACREGRIYVGYKWKYVPKKVVEKIDPEKGTEDWVILDNFPQYKISKDGQIYSKFYKSMLKGTKSKAGREFVDIRDKDGANIKMLVHRLVAMAYLPNPDNYPVVNHLDGNSLNNKVENLEWASYSRNSTHAFETGLNPHKRSVKQMTKRGQLVKTYDSIKGAARAMGVRDGAIHYALKNRKRTCKGYKWKYA
jgi:hypothetical protein